MEKNKALNEYNLLINKARKDFESGLYKGKYTEKHHIIPKCMGGTDEDNNLVHLLCVDHVRAHILLLDIYPDSGKLLFAVNSMFIGHKGERIERIKAFSEMDIKLVSKLREDYKTYLRKNGIEMNDGKIRFKAKQVACINDNKEIVKIYDSISDTKLDNFHPSSVAKAVSGKRKYGGYYWKDLNIIMKEEKAVYDEYLMRLENNNLPKLDLSFTKLSLKEKLKLRPKRKQTEEIRAKISASNKKRFSKTKHNDNKRKMVGNNFRSIKVKDKNLNIIFNSLSDAGRHYNVDKKTIKNWITRGNKGLTLLKKVIIGPNNDEYQSLDLCSKEYGYSKSTISNWIKNYPEKGFYIKYIN